jgi:hypothetical protein
VFRARQYWFTGKTQVKTLYQVRHAVRLHLQAVPATKLVEDGGRYSGATQIGKLVKKMFEAAGRNDLEDARRLIARIPERVPLIAWFENKVAWIGEHDFIAEQGTQTPADDVAVLVFTRVPVQRRS